MTTKHIFVLIRLSPKNRTEIKQHLVHKLGTMTAGSALSNDKVILKICFFVMPLHSEELFRGHFKGAIYTVNVVHSILFILKSQISDSSSRMLVRPHIKRSLNDSHFLTEALIKTRLLVRVCLAKTMGRM